MPSSQLNQVALEDIIRQKPEPVPHRVLQLNGEKLCYECGYDDYASFESCTENFKAALAMRMEMAGAEVCNIHLSCQARGYKLKPKHLPALREWVQVNYGEELGGYAVCCCWDDQEADNGIAQSQYQFIAAGSRHLSVIMSGCKDLSLCSGLHCDWDTYALEDIHGYGSIDLYEAGNVKKFRQGPAAIRNQLQSNNVVPDCSKLIHGIMTVLCRSLIYIADICLKTLLNLFVSVSSYSTIHKKRRATRAIIYLGQMYNEDFKVDKRQDANALVSTLDTITLDEMEDEMRGTLYGLYGGNRSAAIEHAKLEGFRG